MRCSACRQATLIGRSEWVRCPRCRSLIRGENRTAAQARDVHDDVYFGADPSFEMSPTLHLRQYLQFIDRHRPLDGARVIDVGCGVSEMGTLVSAMNAGYLGVELSGTARTEMARRGFDVRASVPEAVEAGPFDVALLIEVIEHTHEPRALLDDVRGGLAAGGVAFVTTPNAAGLKARALGSRWEQARNPTHVCLFTRRALQETLVACGYGGLRWQRWLRNDDPVRRRVVQRVLQGVGLDGGLRVLARNRGC